MARDDEDQSQKDKGLEFLQFEDVADKILAGSKVHPGLAESLVPIWGPARDAVADLQEGDYGGAAFNTGLAVLDGFGGGEIRAGLKLGTRYANEVAKASKAARPFGYERKVRPWIRDKLGAVKGKEEVHHAIISQAWKWPDRITNHPLNLKVLPTKTHRLIHGNAPGGAQYNWLNRTWHGSPEWTKMTAGSAAGRVATGVDQKQEDDD